MIAAVSTGWTSFLSTLSVRRATFALFSVAAASKVFLSTLSVRRATILHDLLAVLHIDISIHALREESDVMLCPGFFLFSYFYPRSP